TEHRRARDTLLLAACGCAAALCPWNAALWWQLARLRLATEIDCDARVLARGADARTYASVLVAAGERIVAATRFAPAFVERRSLLERRIVAMSPVGGPRRSLHAVTFAFVAALCVAVACAAPAPHGPALSSVPPQFARTTVAQQQYYPRFVRIDTVDAEGTAWLRSALARYYPSVLTGDTSLAFVSLYLSSDGRIVGAAACGHRTGHRRRGLSLRHGRLRLRQRRTGRRQRAPRRRASGLQGRSGHDVRQPDSHPVRARQPHCVPAHLHLRLARRHITGRSISRRRSACLPTRRRRLSEARNGRTERRRGERADAPSRSRRPGGLRTSRERQTSADHAAPSARASAGHRAPRRRSRRRLGRDPRALGHTHPQARHPHRRRRAHIRRHDGARRTQRHDRVGQAPQGSRRDEAHARHGGCKRRDRRHDETASLVEATTQA